MNENKIHAKKAVKAKRLEPGDRVGLVAPAGRVKNPLMLKRCEDIIQEMGFVPITGRHVLKIDGSMAGSDDERIEDLDRFFTDDSIAGIFCLSGGWGSLRLLPHFDFAHVRQHPKIIVGGDDNSSLLLAINHMTGLVTLNGLNLDQIERKEDFDRLKTAVSTHEIPAAIHCREPGGSALDGTVFSPVAGSAEGIVCAGNLTALVSLFGTPYEPDLEGRLLILEDKNERSNVLDRWFTTLYLSGKLEMTEAIAFGHLVSCGPKSAYNMLTAEETIGDRLKKLNKPSCFGLHFGQASPTTAIPIGINAKLDCVSGTLEFSEPAFTA